MRSKQLGYLGIGNRRALNVVQRPFSPLDLFATGEQGVWYDPSDLSTMFQDSSGTTPVTAVEQPVGRILDKSGRGNHASQSTAGSRPTLSARYNLLTYSEQFNDAAWTTSAVGVATPPIVTANAGIAPDGTSTADRVEFSLNGGSTTGDFSQVLQQSDYKSGVSYTFSIWLKSNTGLPQSILIFAFNTQLATATVTSEWSRFSVSVTAGSTAASSAGVRIRGTQTAGTADILAWGAQLIVTNDLPSNAYQRIASATDYDADATKFPYYLRFDGSDDSLATSSVDFSGTNKLSAFTALRRLSDAAQGMVLELSATTASNNGTFSLETPSTASGSDFQFISKGTVANTINADDYTNPYSAIITAQSAISTPLSNIRINGIEVDSDAGTQGTGNFGNFPLYVGRRNNSSLPFNGRIYGMIVRGAETPEYLVKITESWLFGKSGITLDTTPNYTFVTLSNGDFVVDAYGNNVFIEVS